MGENSDISKLLRLKRYEQPPPGYYESFLHEFHRRQRAELMRRPSWENLWQKLLSIAPTFRVPQFAYGAMAALAVVASFVIVSPKSGPLQVAASESSASPITLTASQPVTIGDTVPVSASLPPHYVLQSRPVSNEQPLSF